MLKIRSTPRADFLIDANQLIFFISILNYSHTV